MIVEVSHSRYWDVPLDHDQHDDIIHATDAGWFVGYPDGSFRPDQVMTAEQMTTVFDRAFPEGVSRGLFATFMRGGEERLGVLLTTDTTVAPPDPDPPNTSSPTTGTSSTLAQPEPEPEPTTSTSAETTSTTEAPPEPEPTTSTSAATSTTSTTLSNFGGWVRFETESIWARERDGYYLGSANSSAYSYEFHPHLWVQCGYVDSDLDEVWISTNWWLDRDGAVTVEYRFNTQQQAVTEEWVPKKKSVIVTSGFWEDLSLTRADRLYVEIRSTSWTHRAEFDLEGLDAVREALNCI